MKSATKSKVSVNVFDDTLEIPGHVEQVLSSIIDHDFDEPLPRCKDAIRWLEERGLVVCSASGETFPVRATVAGRVLARRCGLMQMDYRLEG